MTFPLFTNDLNDWNGLNDWNRYGLGIWQATPVFFSSSS